jgi:drug/metabolite transporter (DMT)-like permease
VASLQIPFVTGAVVTTIAALVFEHANPLDFDATTWISILYLAGAGSVAAFSLFFYTMKHVDVTVVSYQTFIIPVLAVLLGWALLDEHISRQVAFGAVFIVVGVSIATVFAPRTRERVVLPRPQA